MITNTPDDFSRLETKVDKLTDAINRLVLFEERQANQAISISSIQALLTVNTARILAAENKLEMWVNRGIGAWAVAAALFVVVQAFPKVLGP